MDVASLLKQFFPKTETITIDVFDAKDIYDVYHRIVGVLTQHIDIETTILQAMSYCFYEVLDNVLTHSGKELGTVITYYDAEKHLLDFLVADDGKGVKESLAENEEYAAISECRSFDEMHSGFGDRRKRNGIWFVFDVFAGPRCRSPI